MPINENSNYLNINDLVIVWVLILVAGFKFQERCADIEVHDILNAARIIWQVITADTKKKCLLTIAY